MVAAGEKSCAIIQYKLIFADIINIGNIYETALVKPYEHEVSELFFALRKSAFCEEVAVF